MRIALVTFAALGVIAWLSTPTQQPDRPSPFVAADVSSDHAIAGLVFGASSFRDVVQHYGAGRVAVEFGEGPTDSRLIARYPGSGVAFGFLLGPRALDMVDTLKAAVRDPETFAFAQPIAATARLASIRLQSPWTGTFVGPTEVTLGTSALEVLDAWGEPSIRPELLDAGDASREPDAPPRYVAGPVHVRWTVAGVRRTLTFERAPDRPATEPPSLVRIDLAQTFEPAAPSRR